MEPTRDSPAATPHWREAFASRRCLVTGHTGFKGAWLSLWLDRLGARVTGLALDPPSQPNLFEAAAVGQAIEDRRADLRNFEEVAAAVRAAQPEIVFHLAAQPLVRASYREPKATFDVNVGGAVNLFEALRAEAGVRAIVVVTSDKCYENREWPHAYRETDALGGHDPYSASKGAAEIVAASYERSFFRAAGVGLATARAGNVIGGGDWAEDRIVPDAARALASGLPAPVRNPDSVRPWQHVLEPLCGYLALAARLFAESAGGADALVSTGPWNFGPATDSCCPVRDLIGAFLQAYGSGTWSDLSSGQAGAPREAGLLMLAWDKAWRELGWRPRWGFGEAVGRTGRWYRRHAEGEDGRALCLRDIDDYMETP